MKKTLMATMVVTAFCINTVFAGPLPSSEYAPELKKVEAIVDWGIMLIRFLGGTIAAFKGTVYFYDMILGESTDATKKGLKQLALGLAGLFLAAEGINYMVRKFLQIAMS